MFRKELTVIKKKTERKISSCLLYVFYREKYHNFTKDEVSTFDFCYLLNSLSKATFLQKEYQKIKIIL